MVLNQTIARLVERIDVLTGQDTDVIPWGSPVPTFGDVTRAKVATLGLNPSNKEFVDDFGNELEGSCRRFHTLRSFGLKSWKDAETPHIDAISKSCSYYFERNPYDRWFRKLDRVLNAAGYTFYRIGNTACHLDLIPYATVSKWTELRSEQRKALLTESAESLGNVIRNSPIEMLVLNGQSVVSAFQNLTGIKLDIKEIDDWKLPRRNSPGISGFSYSGYVTSLGGVSLDRAVRVWGFNHNLQSSFGVTNKVMESVASLFAETMEGS